MHTYRSDSTELLTRHRLRAQELKKLEDVQKQADEYAMHACMHACMHTRGRQQQAHK